MSTPNVTRLKTSRFRSLQVRTSSGLVHSSSESCSLRVRKYRVCSLRVQSSSLRARTKLGFVRFEYGFVRFQFVQVRVRSLQVRVLCDSSSYNFGFVRLEYARYCSSSFNFRGVSLQLRAISVIVRFEIVQVRGFVRFGFMQVSDFVHFKFVQVRVSSLQVPFFVRF